MVKRQSEGELVDYCEVCCGGEFEAPKCPKQYMDFDNCIAQNKRVAEAQLAHDKTRMLPSEDELALWLCDHLNYTSRELAKELLKLLKGEAKP